MQWEAATPVGFPVCMRHNDCRPPASPKISTGSMSASPNALIPWGAVRHLVSTNLATTLDHMFRLWVPGYWLSRFLPRAPPHLACGFITDNHQKCAASHNPSNRPILRQRSLCQSMQSSPGSIGCLVHRSQKLTSLGLYLSGASLLRTGSSSAADCWTYSAIQGGILNGAAPSWVALSSAAGYWHLQRSIAFFLVQTKMSWRSLLSS